tara:strand:- start:21284 stop:23704 length:2421 start_codon:yes stop_codon:yes gene_type:complete
VSISTKRTPNVGDLNRAVKKIYDDINDIINSVNKEVSLSTSIGGKAGDIRVVKDSSSKISTTKHKLEFRSDEGWDKVITMPRNPDKYAGIVYNPESETFEWTNMDEVQETTMSSPGKSVLFTTATVNKVTAIGLKNVPSAAGEDGQGVICAGSTDADPKGDTHRLKAMSIDSTTDVKIELDSDSYAPKLTINSEVIDVANIATSALIKNDESFDNVDTKLMTAAAVKDKIDASLPTGNAIIDWTADQGGTNIHAGNYTNTEYSIMASGNSYAAGLVAAGSGTHNSEFLRKDGTWAAIPSASFPTGDSGNAAIYDNSGTPTLKSSITQGEMQTAIGGVYTDTNTQNTTTLSFVDSSDDTILRNTTGGAGSGTDDIKFVAGSNITLTNADADNMTITAANDNTQLDNAGVISKVLTGLNVSGGGAVAATDTILAAFGRLENRVALNDAKVTNTDVNVSIGNLEGKLGEIDTSITIGNSTSVSTTISGDLLGNGELLTFTSATSLKPELILENTTNNNRASIINFRKDPGDGNAASQASTGIIRFKGIDAGNADTNYSVIDTGIVSTTAGDEAGYISLKAMTNSFEQLAFKGTGVADTTQVDVAIAHGTDSNTIIAGHLTVTSGVKFKESSAPTAATGYSHIYSLNDNNLYYQGEDGVASCLNEQKFHLISSFYHGGNNGEWVPFGGSQNEYSTLTGTSTDVYGDDIFFIVPYNLKINTVYLNATRSSSFGEIAGNTTVRLYKNESALSNAVSVNVDTVGYDTNDLSNVFTWDFSAETNTYSAGDMMQIHVDPTNKLYYVTITIAGVYI